MFLPRDAPALEHFCFVPVPVFDGEAFAIDFAGGEHDVRVRVMAVQLVHGKIGNHAPIDKLLLDVALQERRLLLCRQLAG